MSTAKKSLRWVTCVIPARSGSRGLRHKNTRKLQGEPLLVRAINLAQASRRRGETWRILVSTDSAHYARLARGAGAEVPGLRPARLATDKARLIDAVLHTLTLVQGDGSNVEDRSPVIMMTPTTPLTTVRDVRRLLRLFDSGGGVSVASVRADPIAHSWRFNLRDGALDRDGVGEARHHVGRRQESPGIAHENVGGNRKGNSGGKGHGMGEPNGRVVLNGALYVASRAWLLRYRQFVRAGETLALTMPTERSIDIETQNDLDWASFLLAKGENRR